MKARGRLPILRYIARIKNGANPCTMLIFYKALIRSVIEYGCVVYFRDDLKNTERLNKVQYAGIRAAMGYRITTPTNVMQTKAAIMDLTTRKNMLTEKYILKKFQTARWYMVEHLEETPTRDAENHGFGNLEELRERKSQS